MKTRCKMICQSFNECVGHDETNSVKFVPVQSGSKENETFFKYTPAGELTLDIINPNVKFTVGQEYFIDITKTNS